MRMKFNRFLNLSQSILPSDVHMSPLLLKVFLMQTIEDALRLD